MTEPKEKYQPKQGVIETDLDDELVLLDPDTREMFSLNTSGRLIWQKLPDYDKAALACMLVEHYGIEIEQATQDIEHLLAALQKANLVVVS